MLDKKVVSPFVISVVVTILVLSALIISGSASKESKSIDTKNNYYMGHDEYGKNMCSYDEYSYEECDNNSEEDQIGTGAIFVGTMFDPIYG